MKKTYIQPAETVVRLIHRQNILVGSINTSGATFFDDDATGDAMTKGIYDVNLWDEEW